MTFTEIFSHAWQIFLRTRAIWYLGMLAALFGQSEYGVSANVNQRIDEDTFGPSATIDPFVTDLMRSIFDDPWPYISGLIALIAVSVLVSLLLGPIALGALVDATGAAEREEPVSLGASLGRGMGRFPPVFLTGLLLAIPGLILLAVGVAIFVPLTMQLLGGVDEPGPEAVLPALLGTFVCFLPLALLASLVGAVLYFIRQLALRFIVLEGAGAMEGMRAGWGLLRRHLGQVLLVWFILAALGVLVGLALAVPIFTLSLPLTRALFAEGLSSQVIGMLVALVAYSLVAGIAVGGALTGFNATVWTVLYRSVRAQEEPAPAQAAPGQPAL